MSFTDYYNVIAEHYNRFQTSSDRMLRMHVCELFRHYVKQGPVLDLGGGTGLDMAWMIQAGYRIYFIEPAENMRSIAKKTFSDTGHNSRITFVEDQTDMHLWSDKNLPFQEKVNGILLNFAVLNSVKELYSFFEKISLVCQPHGYLFLTVINARLPFILKRYGFSLFKGQMLHGRATFNIHYKESVHETFIYSARFIRKMSADHFDFISCQIPTNSDFMVVILSAR